MCENNMVLAASPHHQGLVRTDPALLAWNVEAEESVETFGCFGPYVKRGTAIFVESGDKAVHRTVVNPVGDADGNVMSAVDRKHIFVSAGPDLPRREVETEGA